ncbi:hypothetical protein BGZ76_010975 [Entomortierella beljakovae]|nr:hypothetical protein BGZ76_010975 [Entomortierella beljakovae]
MSTIFSPTPGQPNHQQTQSTSSSPGTSGSISRPPMSAQRQHPTSSPSSPSGYHNHNPQHSNTSFSSVGSGEAIVQSNGSNLLENGNGNGNGYNEQSMSAISTGLTHLPNIQRTSGSTSPGMHATATTSSQVIIATTSPSPVATTTNQGHHVAASVPSPTTSRQSNHNQQHSNGHLGVTGSTGHTHGGKQKSKPDTSVAPRPSAMVAPAPTPAMHWSRAKVHGQIPPKELRAQTVNLVGESIYVFGGCDTKNCYNTLYIFDADTMHWSQPKTFGSIPPPCRAHSSTLVDNKRLYVFGGGDGPHYFNELYMLDTDTLTWTNPQTTGDRPCRRRAHTTCVYNNCIYVFGGGDGVQALNDTYKLDLSEMRWSEVKVTGQPPIARGYHTSNLIKSQFIVYGGSDGHECFSDVHVLDLDTREWVKVEINRALPRLSHSSTQVGSYLFIVGGHDGSRYSCDVVMLNLVTWSWESRKTYGIPPAGRGYHASLLYDSRLFVFGGYDGKSVFDDIYILDLSTCAYLPQITDFQILLNGEEDGAGYYEEHVSQQAHYS